MDEFLFEDEDGNPTGRNLDPQVNRRGHTTRVCILLTFPKNLDVNLDRRRGDLCCYRSEDLVRRRYRRAAASGISSYDVGWTQRTSGWLPIEATIFPPTSKPSSIPMDQLCGSSATTRPVGRQQP